MRRPFSAGAWVKRLLLRIVLVMAVFWGGGLAVFSIMPVPFSAVMVERQLGAWLSGDFGYVAHSDWVSMDEISPFMGLAVCGTAAAGCERGWKRGSPWAWKRSGAKSAF